MKRPNRYDYRYARDYKADCERYSDSRAKLFAYLAVSAAVVSAIGFAISIVMLTLSEGV